MNTFLDWSKKQLSTIFSIVGIVLTIYFSVFHVPTWYEELRLKRIESMHSDLIDSIQELVYNGENLSEDTIESLIRGKELRSNVQYPYSTDELLVQVQERFMGSRFIPLDQRMRLFADLKALRNSLGQDEASIKEPIIEATRLPQLVAYLGSAIGVIAAVFGLLGVYQRIRTEREAEAEEAIEKKEEDIAIRVREGIELDQSVAEMFTNLLPNHSLRRYLGGFDFSVQLPSGRRLGVEIKYTQTGVIPYKTIEQVISAAKDRDLRGLLISNAELSSNALRRLERHNNENLDVPIETIIFSDMDDLKKRISEYVNSAQ